MVLQLGSVATHTTHLSLFVLTVSDISLARACSCFHAHVKLLIHSHAYSTGANTHTNTHTHTHSLTHPRVHFTSWPTCTVGEVLAVCCRQHGRTDDSGGGPAVATAGDHGVWLWDHRALAKPAVRFGDGDSAQPHGQASGSTASSHDDAVAKSCSAVCFHPKESHTVISAAESWIRWHDARAPSAPITAVQCCSDDDEVNDICVNDRGTHVA